MRLLATLTLLTICSTAIGQGIFTKKPQTFYPQTYIDTEGFYTDSTGLAVIIQNSFPRWGTPFLDSARKEPGFSLLIFFTRIINESTSPVDVTINFPADSFPFLNSSDSYLKVFLPSDTMTLAKETQYTYGLTSVKSFLESGFSKPTKLERVLKPKEAHQFYVGVLYHKSPYGRTGGRAELLLKEHNLFYKINRTDLALIPCGQIVLKN